MQSANRRSSPLRAGAAIFSALLLVLPGAPVYAQRSSRESVRSVNRNPGSGGSWSGRRTSAARAVRRPATAPAARRRPRPGAGSRDSEPGREQVGRLGDGGPQPPDEQRREPGLVEDVRDGRTGASSPCSATRTRRTGMGSRPVGKARRALRLWLGVRGRGPQPLRPEGRGRGLRRAGPVRRRGRR